MFQITTSVILVKSQLVRLPPAGIFLSLLWLFEIFVFFKLGVSAIMDKTVEAVGQVSTNLATQLFSTLKQISFESSNLV